MRPTTVALMLSVAITGGSSSAATECPENLDIYLAEPNGDDAERIRRRAGSGRVPRLVAGRLPHRIHERQGRRLRIYVMAADGSAPLNLTEHPSEDKYSSWSPDGSRLAFASNR